MLRRGMDQAARRTSLQTETTTRINNQKQRIMNLEELLKKPTDQLTAAELKAVLAHKEKDEKANEEKTRKQYQNEKNKFVDDVIGIFTHYNTLLQDFKKRSIGDAQLLNAKVYEINGKEPKDNKSFQLKNEDDTAKIVVENQERFEFTEEAPVHIEAIKEIFKNKFAERNKGMYKFLDAILMKNGKGDYDPKLLTKARNQAKELGDADLITEFEKLTDCQRVTETATYIRAYKKDENGKYQDVSLNFSAL